MPEYTATIEKNLLDRQWVVRVRYVNGSSGPNGRRTFASFVLYPSHQGDMFFSVCEQIEPAIELHRQGKLATRATAYV